MACHRISKDKAMDLKRSDVTRMVSDLAWVSMPIDKPISQYMTAGYLELKANAGIGPCYLSKKHKLSFPKSLILPPIMHFLGLK